LPLIILSILVQLALVVHIIKTGRNTTWVFIVLFFPLIGSLAYFIVELLPELLGSRTGRTAAKKVAKAINPDKELREAVERYEIAATPKNALTLANAHLQHGHYAEAKELLVRARVGLFSDDPDMMLGLSSAHFGLGEYAETLLLLDELKRMHPKRTTGEGHLLYARALQESDRIAEAIKEYEALVAYFPGPEPACRLAMILRERGESGRAEELLQSVLQKAKISGRHYNDLYKEWVALARREARG